MTRFGKVGGLILGILILVTEPVVLWAQDSSGPPTGKSGSSRKLPSGRSRVAPPPQIPRSTPQQVPEQADVMPKGKRDRIVPSQSTIEPSTAAPSDSGAEAPLVAPSLGPIPGRSRPVQKLPEQEMPKEEPKEGSKDKPKKVGSARSGPLSLRERAGGRARHRETPAPTATSVPLAAISNFQFSIFNFQSLPPQASCTRAHSSPALTLTLSRREREVEAEVWR